MVTIVIYVNQTNYQLLGKTLEQLFLNNYYDFYNYPILIINDGLDFDLRLFFSHNYQNIEILNFALSGFASCWNQVLNQIQTRYFLPLSLASSISDLQEILTLASQIDATCLILANPNDNVNFSISDPLIKLNLNQDFFKNQTLLRWENVLFKTSAYIHFDQSGFIVTQWSLIMIKIYLQFKNHIYYFRPLKVINFNRRIFQNLLISNEWQVKWWSVQINSLQALQNHHLVYQVIIYSILRFCKQVFFQTNRINHRQSRLIVKKLIKNLHRAPIIPRTKSYYWWVWKLYISLRYN